MTADLDNLSINSECKGKGKLYLGNGNSLTISHVGSSFIPTNTHSLALHNVLHVPKITKNLISVSQFTKDNNVIVEFFSDGCMIKEKETKQVLLRGFLNQGLYQLDTSQLKRSLIAGKSQVHVAGVDAAFSVHNSVTSSSDDGSSVSPSNNVVLSSSFSCNKSDQVSCSKSHVNVNNCIVSGSCFLLSGTRNSYVSYVDKIAVIWHNRLGHPSICVLDKVLNKGYDKITSRNIAFYNSCPLGKFHRLFTGLSQSRANKPLELVYSDVWGPAPLLSNKGYRYYVHFLDDYSRFT